MWVVRGGGVVARCLLLCVGLGALELVDVGGR